MLNANAMPRYAMLFPSLHPPALIL